MSRSVIAFLPAIMAMALPLPVVAAKHKPILARLCGETAGRLALPVERNVPEPDQPCNKACHFACRRREA